MSTPPGETGAFRQDCARRSRGALWPRAVKTFEPGGRVCFEVDRLGRGQNQPPAARRDRPQAAAPPFPKFFLNHHLPRWHGFRRRHPGGGFGARRRFSRWMGSPSGLILRSGLGCDRGRRWLQGKCQGEFKAGAGVGFRFGHQPPARAEPPGSGPRSLPCRRKNTNHADFPPVRHNPPKKSLTSGSDCGKSG
jgi:hypothetical protein